MTGASFICAHAAHVEWRLALDECQQQLETQAALRQARQGGAPPLTLGWCYLSDYYAQFAEPILSALQQGWPGVAWVGTDGVGVSASGVEYFDEPAMVLMMAPLILCAGLAQKFLGRALRSRPQTEAARCLR